MKRKMMLLSYGIEKKTPLYGETPAPRMEVHTSISRGDSSNSFIITLHNHTSTHVDAPWHFTKSGKKIGDYRLDELIFEKTLVIDVKKGPGGWIGPEDMRGAKLKDCDFIILRTGFGKHRGDGIYRTKNPGVSPEFFSFIRTKYPNVRGVGIDTVSIASRSDREKGRLAHRMAFEKKKGFGEPLLIVEDMNLAPLKGGKKLARLIIVPIRIDGIDSAPCVVLAER